jgi:polar amino acid transport system substrate-binding protein
MNAREASELTPTGKLRIGINLGNFLLVTRSSDGRLQGVVPDLAQEIARRLGGVPVEHVASPGAGGVADGAKAGAWDVAFIGAEPARAAEIAFTNAYLEIPATYLVPAGSAIRTLADVDKPGTRIATAARSAYDLFLSRSLRHAQLVRAEGIPASYDLFVGERLDALSGLLPRLTSDVTRLPGARILEGKFTAIQQAIGTPKARTAAAAWLAEFVADIKRSGLVAQLIEKHGVKGVNVAPV